jgi:hypothetical protein
VNGGMDRLSLKPLTPYVSLITVFIFGLCGANRAILFDTSTYSSPTNVVRMRIASK